MAAYGLSPSTHIWLHVKTVYMLVIPNLHYSCIVHQITENMYSVLELFSAFKAMVYTAHE